MSLKRRFAVFALALGLVGGGRAVASAAEALVTNQVGDSLSFVDLDTMTTVVEIKIGGKPAGIAIPAPSRLGGRIAYVTAPESKDVVEIDIAKREIIRRIKVGDAPLGIAVHPGGTSIYVADWYAHKIHGLDWDDGTGSECAQMQMFTGIFCNSWEIAVGQSPSGLAVTPDGKLLLSADRDDNQVSIIDIASRKVIATVPVGERPFGITIDLEGKRAYTANVGSDDVSVVDIAQRKVIGSVKTGRRPYAVALARGKGFVTDQYVGTITVFDVATLQLLKTLEACDHPEGIDVSLGEDAVYVACWGDNILLKIDPESLEITGKASVGDGPRAFGKFLR